MNTIDTEEQLRALLGKPHPLTESKISDELNDTAEMFLSKASLVFIATTGADGGTTVSPKGDAPGFVEVVDSKTLHIPERPGNKLMHSLGNIVETGQIGLIALIPGTEETLRVNGRCRLLNDEGLNKKYGARGKPAQLVIEVAVEQVFLHCAKAFKRSKAWQPDEWLEKQDISFGKEIARGKLGESNSLVKKAASKTLAGLVDKAVKDDYKNNL